MKPADWPPERLRAGARGTLPMIVLKDDHPNAGDMCPMCAGLPVATWASARWPEPWDKEAL